MRDKNKQDISTDDPQDGHRESTKRGSARVTKPSIIN